MLVIKNLCKVKNIFLKIETNIRQRGIGNPNANKLGRCIKELERIYGIQNGNNQHDRVPKLSEGSVYSQKQLADMIGISVDTLNNYKIRLERIESLKAEQRKSATQFGGDGNISTTVGTTRDIVALKLGIGSGKQYEKEKYIVENHNEIYLKN